MRKTSILLISLLSTLILSCASSKNTDAPLTSNENTESIAAINKNCSPYRDKYVEFTIITNEIQKSKYEDKNIFKVILDHGKLDLDLTEKYKNLGATEEEEEFLKKSASEIKMLLNYLYGFYFEDLLPEGLKIAKDTNNDLTYSEEYEWNNYDCINYYIIENGLLSEFQTYKKNDPQIQVDTKYKYRTLNDKNYLLGFESTNNFYSFDFALRIDYLEMAGILVPDKFTITLKHAVDNDGKSDFVTTKFKILANNQFVQ